MDRRNRSCDEKTETFSTLARALDKDSGRLFSRIRHAMAAEGAAQKCARFHKSVSNPKNEKRNHQFYLILTVILSETIGGWNG